MSESLKPSGPVSHVAFRWMAGAAGLIGLAGLLHCGEHKAIRRKLVAAGCQS